MAWTKEQLAAIQADGSNYVVSAGAGSGKTAVLTQRVFELLKKGVRLDQLLVLTFTNSAAHEMKERVRQKVGQEPSLAHIVSEIEASDISTFDAYALSLVKKYHYLINVGKDVSIVDESIIEIKKHKIIDEIFDEKYAAKDPNFINMISKFVIRSDDDLKDFVLRIDQLGDLQIDKEKFFQSYIADHYDHDFIQKNIAEFDDFIREKAREVYEGANRYEDTLMSETVQSAIDPVIEARQHNQLNEALLIFRYPRGKKLSENDKLTHEMLKKGTEKFSAFAGIGTEEVIISRYLSTKENVSVLLEIVTEMNRRLADFKSEHDAYTFSDIAKMALYIVSSTPAGSEIKNHLRYIMIDEYQDTSDLQENFVSQIANDNVYMVGDVKQSIYRFRKANSEIFAQKYDLFRLNKGGRAIDLKKNFRSRAEVIEDINSLFGKLMTRKNGGADYQHGHIIEHGSSYYEQEGQNGNNNHLEFWRYSIDEHLEKAEQEAKLIATDIVKKINDGYKVYDESAKTIKSASFRDFAILIDRKSKFDVYQRVFDSYGIPLHAEKDEEIANSDVMLVFQNLIRLLESAIENTYDTSFKHAYVSVARSFLVGMSDQRIFEIVKNNSFLDTPIMEKVKNILLSGGADNLSSQLGRLVKEFAVFEKLIHIGDVMANIHKIESMIESAKTMENLGYSLKDFVDYFDDLENYQVSMTSATGESVGDCVRLMTIHKSKGLQFRIIYYPGLSSPFNNPETRSSFLTSNLYGIILPVIDDSESSNIFHYLIKEHEQQEELSEKIRLLYVAFTRAQEKMIALVPKAENADLISLRYAKSFYDLLHFFRFDESYGKDKTFEVQNLSSKPMAEKDVNATLAKINLERRIIKKERASRTTGPTTDEKQLRFGTHIHYLLEIVDLAKKDTSFIVDIEDKHIIDHVLSSSLLANAHSAKIYKEYEFIDDQTGLRGVIDLLLIYEDHIDIVDFKLKNIDDENYEKQLTVYKNHIGKHSNLPIHCYLLAALTGETSKIC